MVETKSGESKPAVVFKAELEVISRELVRVRVDGVPAKLTKGPIPIRVATPAGVSNEITIDAAASAAVAGPTSSFRLNNSELRVEVVKDPKGSLALQQALPQLDLEWDDTTIVVPKSIQVHLPRVGAATHIVRHTMGDAASAGSLARSIAGHLLANINANGTHIGLGTDLTSLTVTLDAMKVSADPKADPPNDIPAFSGKVVTLAKPLVIRFYYANP